MKRNSKQCLESWADELRSRNARVRDLIGDAHWLSDGHHKEELIREFLAKYLPARFRINRGFISTAFPDEPPSGEIDILISDTESEIPWFLEGNLSIVPPRSAVAQIHIKTEFNTKELADVLLAGSKNQEVREISDSTPPIWFGAFFFQMKRAKTAVTYQAIWDSAKRSAKSKGLKKLHIPDCVAIIDGPIFLTKLEDSNAHPSLAAYECGALSPAIFLNVLYDSLPLVGRDIARRGEWFQFLSNSYRKQPVRIAI